MRAACASSLQEAIRQIDSARGVVATIGDDEVRRSGGGSKSGLLARTPLGGQLIIVVTIQTFPHAMEVIRTSQGHEHKRFAVVADEAHSSRAGETANTLKAVLTAAEITEATERDEVDVEAVLAADATARASAENVSYSRSPRRRSPGHWSSSGARTLTARRRRSASTP